MSTYKVGVNLEYAAGSPRAVAGVATGISGILVNAVKGPLNVATLVTTLKEYERIFGDVSPVGCTSYEQVAAFFADAVTAYLYVTRIAHSTAAKATKTFVDRQGSPASTLRIDAKSHGAWGNSISVAITDHNILSTTLAVLITAADTSATLVSTSGLEVGSDVVFYNGTNTEYRRLIQVDHAAKKIYWTTGLTYGYAIATSTVKSKEFNILVYYQGVLVETHTGLSMNDSVSFFCEKVITDSTSEYIAAVDPKAVDTDYTDLPATATVTALLSGADGLSDVVGADYTGVKVNKTGVFAFDNIPGIFRICCPNPKLSDAVPATAYGILLQTLIDYAFSRQTVEVYADVPYDTSIANAIIFASQFASEKVAIFYPWGTADAEAPVWLAPSSAVLGAAVKKDRERGVFKNVGNEKLSYFVDVKYHADVDEGELLNDAGVNLIRAETGRGIITWGGRTLSADLTWRFLNEAEYWNYVGASLLTILKKYAFEPNDPSLWARILQDAGSFFAAEQLRGALYNPLNPGGVAYALQMDADNNPGAQIADGIAVLDAEYTMVGTAEKIVIRVKNSPGGFSITAG